MMNIYTPERGENEEYEQYRLRRRISNLPVVSRRKPALPTIFVQHFNKIKNPNPKGRR